MLVAASGGGDSAALLHVMARLAPRLGIDIVAHGVDHGLRPEAAGELDIAAGLAQRLSVPFSRSRVELAAGGNLQARARNARYEELYRAAERSSAALVATGHHADDRAETVLLRLLRGAGPRGLAVLPARVDRLIRPLISARRGDILRHNARHHIESCSDPSNSDRRFSRARVRHELLPLLEELSPSIVEHLCALAEALLQGEPPPVVDAHGQPVPLGRAQALALRRALALGQRDARIRLPGGRVLRIDRRTGAPLLVAED